MDRFTYNRLRDEAIRRAQDRASLRKSTHTSAGSPLRRVSPRFGEGLGEQPNPPRDGPMATNRHAAN